MHAAVMPPPLLLELPALLLLLLLEPHAVRLSAAATPRIPIEAVVLRIRLRLPVRRYGGAPYRCMFRARTYRHATPPD